MSIGFSKLTISSVQLDCDVDNCWLALLDFTSANHKCMQQQTKTNLLNALIFNVSTELAYSATILETFVRCLFPTHAVLAES